MNYLWVFALVIVFAAGANFLRKKALHKLLNEIYTSAYVKKDRELFLLHINSPQAKMLMSEATRQFIKLNYYITFDDEEKMVKTCEKLRKMHLDKANTKAFYSLAIGYYTEKGREDAFALLQELKKKCEHTKDQELILLYMDCQLLYDIYIRKDITKIEPLKDMIESGIDPDSKAVYRIRLALLYEFADQRTESKKQLKLAYKEGNEQVKKKVDHILKEGW